MRVAVASSGLGHVTRGIETWAADLGVALAERGETVVLCKGGGRAERPIERVLDCWQRDAEKTRRLLEKAPRRFVWRLGLGSGYDVEQTSFAIPLIRLLRRERIDVLHVQDPRLALLAQWARKVGLVRTRTILAHGTEEPDAFLERIDYLQHLAPWHLERARAAGVWKPTWTAIPNFVDTERFAPQGGALRAELGIPADALVALTSAAIKRHHKRIDYLIDEFTRLRSEAPDLPAWLIVAGGREADTDELIALGTEKLGERIKFFVRFPRERMADLYRTADVFVLASLKEMMPIALLEATASGLPCLVNRDPVVEWMAGPGGEAIDMAQPGALCDALSRLLGAADKRRAFAAAAREHCLENFGREKVVDRIVDYYRFALCVPAPRMRAGALAPAERAS